MLEENDRAVFNLAVQVERLEQRIVRIEKVLVAIYDRLPKFIQAGIAEERLSILDDEPPIYTVRHALLDMHRDSKHGKTPSPTGE